MSTRKKCVLLTLLALGLCVSASAQAEFVITNGDFEAGAGGGDVDNVTLWYDDVGGGFWTTAWESDRPGVTPNGSMVVVFCAWNTVEGDPLTGSYVYQSIGTSSGESSITIGFDWGHPDDVAAGRIDGITVAVYASDGTTEPNDGVDINGAAGFTLLDSASYSHVAEGTDGEVFPVVVTLDLSGANEGDEIFLRFNNTSEWPILDNVQIISETAAPLAKIMWISDNKGFGSVEPNMAADQGWVDLLTSLGYEVIYKNQNEYIDGQQYWRTLDPNKVAELEAADLIILSRNGDSGSYSTLADNEPNLWNAVSTPLISFSAHMSRVGKWGWINSTGTVLGKDAKINVVDPTSVIFAGVTPDANDQVEAYSAQWNMDWVTGAVDAGNGKVLATRSTDGLVAIATWEAGEAYFDGGTAVAGGTRMLFIAGTGSKNTGDNYQPDGAYNLTADGEKIFINAVKYMLNKNTLIVYVTSVKDQDKDGVQDDLSWVEWLTAQGYSVDVRPGNWIDPLDPNEIAELEAADLIIASRGMDTGQYDGTETPKWNDLSTPIICTNAWMVRNNRWKWMNSGTANKDAGSPLMAVEQLDHPIFAGVELDLDNVVGVLDETVASGHTSFLTDFLDAGNGVLLASSVGGLYTTAWIAEWQPGVEFYDGAGQIAGGKRLLFMAGTQDDPYLAENGNTAPVGVFNLNANGAQMFLNAINYMLAE